MKLKIIAMIFMMLLLLVTLFSVDAHAAEEIKVSIMKGEGQIFSMTIVKPIWALHIK